MIKLTKSVCLVAVFLFTLSASQMRVLGQEDVDGFKIFPLQFVDAAEVLNLVDGLVQDDAPRMVMDRRLNRVYAHGHPNSLKLLERLIAEIDVETPPVEAGTIIKVFRLGNSAALDVANVLSDLIGTEQAKTVRLSVDESQNSIVVSGKPVDLEVMEALIQRLDDSNGGEKQTSESTPENIIVRVTWLVDGYQLNEEQIQNLLRQPVPAHDKLVKGLIDSGSMERIRSLTSSATSIEVHPSTQKPNKFANTSMRDVNGIMHSMAAEGTVQPVSGGKYKLDISLNLIQGQVELTVGSTISLPKNHPVAFSISDVGDFKSAAVVEILDAR